MPAPAFMRPSTLVAAFNRLPFWRTRVRVWGFVLTAPTFDRWLYLWMHKLGWMGRQERQYLEKVIRPGMHVADVGANLGLYSLLIARTVGPAGRVYAFEPDRLMAEALRVNLAANACNYAEVFACAIGAESGEAVLQRNAMNSGDNRLGHDTGTALHSEVASVPVRALDDVLLGRQVNFVKMDVQGWEGQALRGIGGLLDANPGLQLYLEFWPHGLRRAGTEVAQLAATFAQLRLQVTVAQGPDSTSAVDLESLARTLSAKGYTNLLARRT